VIDWLPIGLRDPLAVFPEVQRRNDIYHMIIYTYYIILILINY